MTRAAPSRRLAPAARLAWSLEAMIWAIPLVIGALIGGGALRDEHGALHALGVALPIGAAVVGLYAVVVLPNLRWARFRWELRDEELDLVRGTITRVRTIVPISRVQHVDVRRSAISQFCGVSTVVLHTAAGETVVPWLQEGDATALRDRIADLAHEPDEL